MMKLEQLNFNSSSSPDIDFDLGLNTCTSFVPVTSYFLNQTEQESFQKLANDDQRNMDYNQSLYLGTDELKRDSPLSLFFVSPMQIFRESFYSPTLPTLTKSQESNDRNQVNKLKQIDSEQNRLKQFAEIFNIQSKVALQEKYLVKFDEEISLFSKKIGSNITIDRIENSWYFLIYSVSGIIPKPQVLDLVNQISFKCKIPDFETEMIFFINHSPHINSLVDLAKGFKDQDIIIGKKVDDFKVNPAFELQTLQLLKNNIIIDRKDSKIYFIANSKVQIIENENLDFQNFDLNFEQINDQGYSIIIKLITSFFNKSNLLDQSQSQQKLIGSIIFGIPDGSHRRQIEGDLLSNEDLTKFENQLFNKILLQTSLTKQDINQYIKFQSYEIVSKFKQIRKQFFLQPFHNQELKYQIVMINVFRHPQNQLFRFNDSFYERIDNSNRQITQDSVFLAFQQGRLNHNEFRNYLVKQQQTIKELKRKIQQFQ